MAASRTAKSSWRICRRYKIFFYVCFLVLSIQLFLGYNFYQIHTGEASKAVRVNEEMTGTTLKPKIQTLQSIIKDILKTGKNESQHIPSSQNTFLCDVAEAKEALSAISRATSQKCKSEITRVACLNENNKLYPLQLPRLCRHKVNHTYGKFLGCFKDDQKDRDLSNVNTQFPASNSPYTCINYCLNGGYQYAGVQYKEECWCGRTYGKFGTLPDTSCSAVCPGNQSETCGGYNAQRIFSTGLPGKRLNLAPLVNSQDKIQSKTPVRIVFVLTVNGRAVRQVKRLISALYQPQHYFYIHVDKRSAYMYRELLSLEHQFPNVRLCRERFATIWGGASLLQAHLTFMKNLLEMTDWKWDYYINLSESDYPVKTTQQLTWFLTAHKGKNFLKSNGRETPVFIKKQGLSHLFYECDNHLWRLGKCPLQEGILYDGGSDWIALYRDFCEYSINSQDALVTGLKEAYKYTLLPVESFFHTLLLNSEFCGTMVDNNLHLVNWRRKQGCKCQHKNQVDWCGCSPNVFKADDLERLLNYKAKPMFFVRKFEPIISQEIVNQVDMLLGKELSDTGLMSYWHNDFHHLDPQDRRTDLWLTFIQSLVRRTRNIMVSTYSKCAISNAVILESHILNVADSFYRYVIKYNATLPDHQFPVTFESQYSFRQHYKIINPVGPIGRLVTLEVGSDFDLKELLFRNYPKWLGPESDVRLRYIWRYGSAFSVTVAWIDPAGVIASYNDITVGTDSFIDQQNPKLKTPLRPGVWTVRILYKLNVCAEVQFLVLPFSVKNGVPLTAEQVGGLHNGPEGMYSHTNYSQLSQAVGVKDSKELYNNSVINGKKFGAELEKWIDSLTMEFWSVQDACTTEALLQGCPPLEICKDTKWSSLSPDPKTELSAVSNYTQKAL